ERCDQELLLRFSYYAGFLSFTGFKPTSNPIDLARAEATFRPNKKGAIALSRKAERCAFLRLPTCPVYHVTGFAFRVPGSGIEVRQPAEAIPAFSVQRQAKTFNR